MQRDLADSLERQAFLINVLAIERLLKIRNSRRTRNRRGSKCPRNEKPAQTSESEAGLNTKQCEEIMTQSAIPAQELIKRLCADRKISGTSVFNDPKKFSELRRVVDQLPIIRELGNKNLHGWELDIEEDVA